MPSFAPRAVLKLCVQRRDDQTGIELRDVSTQQRFEPGFGRRAIKSVTMIEC